jgi:hypothetical protein
MKAHFLKLTKQTGHQAFITFFAHECTLKQALVLYLLLKKEERLEDQNESEDQNKEMSKIFGTLPEYIKVVIPGYEF